MRVFVGQNYTLTTNEGETIDFTAIKSLGFAEIMGVQMVDGRFAVIGFTPSGKWWWVRRPGDALFDVREPWQL